MIAPKLPTSIPLKGSLLWNEDLVVEALTPGGGLYTLGRELGSELAVVKLVYSNLRKKDVKNFVSTFCSKYQRLCAVLGVGESSEGLRVVYEDVEIFAIGGIPLAFRLREEFVPTLVAVKTAGVGSTHYAVVDEGAVKHILRGADVMAPGIVEVSGFAVGDVVAVWAPGKVSPIAVGRALMSSEEVLRIRRGRAIENLHYAGDRIWEASLEVIKRFSGG
jgi:PUA domain protein